MKVVNLSLPATGEWVDVNTLSGIDVGSDLSVQCTGTTWVRLQESDTKPDTLDQGKLITNLSEDSANAVVNNNPIRLWARSTKTDRRAEIAVQQI